MASTNDEQSTCTQLLAAADLMLSPVAPKAQRIEAFQMVEDFKLKSPLAVNCGFLLARGQIKDDHMIRHFGLKILEDVIKLRWNEMNAQQKFFVKENSVKLVEHLQQLSEANFIKDGISRLVVEIAKREWPQHWPSFLSELNRLCQAGDAQTEIVMLIMLRLVEDVAVLQNLEQNQRRKEIYQALTANMEEIFAFLLQLLEKHYKAYSAEGHSSATLGPHGKVCQAVLNTFSAFVEWVAMSHIMANDKYLIRCLCHLLSDPHLQLNAAECLLSIVTWKFGKVADRMQLMSLFSTDMMAPLFAAAERANAQTLEEEQHYVFLKKMVQILAELGGQVCALWTPKSEGNLWQKEMKDSRPENFEIYLNALLAFAGHNSQTVNHMVNELWVKFFRHAEIPGDSVFKAFIPKWADTAIKKTVKVGYPDKTDFPACAYSALDFDIDEEWLSFFARYRIIILEGIRLIATGLNGNVDALMPYRIAENWLKTVLSAQPPSKTAYLELDAIALVLDSVLTRLSSPNLDAVYPPASELCQSLFSFTTEDHDLLSSVLSCISSMMTIVGHCPDQLLLAAMNKIFACITTSGGQPVGKQTETVRGLRRHGCALMVKLSTRQPRVLLPMFAHLRDTVVGMKAQGQISQMEFSSLVEALVLISNCLEDYNAQNAFITAICEPVIASLKSNLSEPLSDPRAFMKFVGLSDALPVNPDDDPRYQNRSELAFSTMFLLSVVRRAAYPTSLEKCRSGGFVISEAAGCLALRNPAWDVASVILPYYLSFAKTLNNLWSPESIAQLHPDYAKALQILEAEKNTICGIGNREKNAEAKKRTPFHRMQTFVFELYENNYHFLSQLCSTTAQQFYATPGLAQNVIASVFDGLNYVPDYRLRAIVRLFIKSLVNKCPKMHYSAVLAPIFEVCCPYMQTRLADRWKYLATLRESPNFDEDDTNSQEVVDDVVCRHLAREYLDVVKAILTSGGGGDVPLSTLAQARSNSITGGENADEAGSNNSQNGGGQNKNGSNNTNTNPKDNNAVTLSELGRLVLGHPKIGGTVIVTVLGALTWPDTPSSVRASTLLELILPALISNGQLNSQDAGRIMYSILSAIHELGQHELNYITLTQLAIQAYEWMRPQHPVIVEVLAQVPGCKQEDLKRFDDRMMMLIKQNAGKENNRDNKSGDRTKKDMFKKLISQFIGKDVAKMFKHEVVIKNLPTLQMASNKQKTPSLDEQEKNDIGISSLFSFVN